MLGLPEDAMKRMLMKGLPGNPNSEVYHSEIQRYLIPNIVELISANNEAILFQLKDESSEYDQKYQALLGYVDEATLFKMGLQKTSDV